jgi:hypothetical protein
MCYVHPAERVCDGWQAGWPVRPLPLADNPGGRWQADGHESNSSFATLRFADANTATLELVAHTGCVLYRLVKPNPRSRQGGEAAAAAAARVATEGGGGLGCYEPIPHTPRAVLEYQEEKRRQAMMAGHVATTTTTTLSGL